MVPVVIVELGQSVNLTCAFQMKYQSNTWLYWFKQSAGDTLNLIVIQQRRTSPMYQPKFNNSRFNITYTDHGSNLTILSIVEQDEGMYHCSQKDTLESTWSGTYLSIKEKSTRTSRYTVVQESTSVHPTDSKTLQCSVLSDSGNKTCSGEPSVFWFRAGPEKSFPDIIYTDAKGAEDCEKRSDTQKRCVYNFSKNVSSSDAGTYYCAVATCGQILFANEINLGIDGFSVWSPEAMIFIFSLSAALAISLICMAVLISSINRIKCDCQESVKVQEDFGQNKQQNDEDKRMYSAAIFAMMKTDNTKRKKIAERQMIFVAIKAFGR
ncbi:uncharacterized protein LOC105922978 [Fundulus heteroclitus]|uniref:uncharacterized protein LOC105922978 n=1 Tax=Fundulus heteroclitus TaxID=8078 RepID=UPI00165A4CAA|nr:uncharacterized protein LOC105922978 [Fundulus heteroclitus]